MFCLLFATKQLAGDSLRQWWEEVSPYPYWFLVLGACVVPLGILTIIWHFYCKFIASVRHIQWRLMWPIRAKGAAANTEHPVVPSESVVLHDSLAHLEPVFYACAGDVIREPYNAGPQDDVEMAKKVTRIGVDGLVLYQNLRLPRQQGTIRIDVKFPDDPGRFEWGVILAAINAEPRPEPELYLQIDSDRFLHFGYTRTPGDWTVPAVTSKLLLKLGVWYRVAVTWGPKGMKMAVADRKAPNARAVTQQRDFTQPICELVTHFGIGRMYEREKDDDKKAHNFLVSDLWVTNIQEF